MQRLLEDLYNGRCSVFDAVTVEERGGPFSGDDGGGWLDRTTCWRVKVSDLISRFYAPFQEVNLINIK